MPAKIINNGKQPFVEKQSQPSTKWKTYGRVHNIGGGGGGGGGGGLVYLSLQSHYNGCFKYCSVPHLIQANRASEVKLLFNIIRIEATTLFV